MVVKRLVEKVMAEKSASRDYDNLLVLDVWRRCGLALPEDWEALAMRLPKVQTIGRQRATIQNEEKRLRPSSAEQTRRARHRKGDS